MHEPLHITVVDPDSQTVEKVREATEEYLSVITPILPRTPFLIPSYNTGQLK
jgi:hypothetical protein